MVFFLLANCSLILKICMLCGNSRFLLIFSRMVGAMTYRMTVALLYYRLLPCCSNCWCTGSCTRIRRAVLQTVNMTLLRTGRLSLICSKFLFLFEDDWWIRSTRILQRHSIELPAVSGCVLTFLVEFST
jgi:hypothetical protein